MTQEQPPLPVLDSTRILARACAAQGSGGLAKPRAAMRQILKFRQLAGHYAIVRLAPDAPAPGMGAEGRFRLDHSHT